MREFSTIFENGRHPELRAQILGTEYILLAEGQQLTISGQTLFNKLMSGETTKEALIWTYNLTDWQPIFKVAPFDVIFSPPVVKSKPALPVAGERMVKTVHGVEYPFHWCPAGSFTMGNSEGFENEKPAHPVTLTHGFWMLETPVTQGMWENVLGETVQQKASQGTCRHDLSGIGPEFPMYYINCDAFCEALSRKLHLKISLPTEAQWEYACKSYGAENTLDSMAWYDSNSDSTTHPVGQKRPNKWGLCDMLGNVWEWCSDWENMNYYSQSPEEAPSGAKRGLQRVFRGGSWGSDAEICRSTCRDRCRPTIRSNFLGCRVISENSEK